MERERLIRKEIERLGKEGAALARDWEKLPRLVLSFLLVIPAGFVWGFVGVFFGIFAVLGLLFTAYYLLYVRRRESSELIEELERELKALGSAEPKPGAKPTR